jgi:hypothetical protein
MSKQMNTLSDKVDAVSVALIIKLLKFLYELAKQFMSTLEIGWGYCPLLQEVNT